MTVMSDLNNSQPWEAASHPELAKRKPDELFEPEFAERYEKLHDDIWQRMARLHGTIVTLETMADFPFNDLYGPNDMEFWHLVSANFFEMAILLMHGLTNDSGDANTLKRLNKHIGRQCNWRDDSLRKVFVGTKRARKFDRTQKEIQKRIEGLRHQRIAHRPVDWRTGSPKQPIPGVTLEELRKVFDKTHDLFDALSFGIEYETLMGDYGPGTVRGKPIPTSLDRVLDAVIRDSDVVNRPERRRESWPIALKHMAPEKLKILNELRKRVGLPEA